MKTILAILILLLIPFKGISQTTDINLSTPQGNELVKGLEQGELLKKTVADLSKLLTDLEKAQKLDKDIKAELNGKIAILNQMIADKEKFIENQDRLHLIELAKEKERNNKRFGFGIVGGYGAVTNATGDTFQSFIGVGFSYDIFRF